MFIERTYKLVFQEWGWPQSKLPSKNTQNKRITLGVIRHSKVKSTLVTILEDSYAMSSGHCCPGNGQCPGNTTSFLSHLGFSCFSDSKHFSYCFSDSKYSLLHMYGVDRALPGFKYHFKYPHFSKKFLYLFTRPCELVCTLSYPTMEITMQYCIMIISNFCHQSQLTLKEIISYLGDILKPPVYVSMFWIMVLNQESTKH